MEDREFGSLPTVFLPRTAHLQASQPRIRIADMRPNSRFNRPVESTTVSEYMHCSIDDPEFKSAGCMVQIHLPGSDKSISRTLKQKRRSSGIHRGKGKRHSTSTREGTASSSPPASGAGSRKTSSSGPSASSPSSSSTPRPQRGGWNSRTNSQGSNWNKQQRVPSGVVH